MSVLIKGDVLISEVSLSVFSPAYLRYVGPTSVQYKIPFDDVGIGIIQKLCCGYRLLPHHALLSCLEFAWGARTLLMYRGVPLYVYVCTCMRVCVCVSV